jgi:hypothetical protein
MLRLSETNWIASQVCRRRLPLRPLRPRANQNRHELLGHHRGLNLHLSSANRESKPLSLPPNLLCPPHI